MSIIPIDWTSKIEGGILSLSKTEVGLEAFNLLFDAELAPATSLSITVTPAVAPKGSKNKDEKTLDTEVISGQATSGGKSFTVDFEYLPKTGKVTKIELTETLTDGYEGLSLPAPAATKSGFQGLSHISTFTVPAQGTATTCQVARQIKGSFKVGEKTIDIHFYNPSPQGPFFINTDISGGGLSLADLAHLLGSGSDHNQDLKEIPSVIRKATDAVSLKDLFFKIDPKDSDTLTYISILLAFENKKMWTITEDLKIGCLTVKIDVDYPLNTVGLRFPRLKIMGKMVLAGGKIDLSLSWPDWSIVGQLEKGTAIQVGQLLQHFDILGKDGKEKGKVNGKGFSELTISGLTLTARPIGEPKSFYFYISMDKVWSIGLPRNQNFEIEQLSLSIDYKTGLPAAAQPAAAGQLTNAKGTFRLNFAGKLKIASVEIFLMAGYAGAGWQFDGGTQPETPIEIGEFMAALAAKLGASKKVDFLKNLKLKYVRASFNTESKNFTFECETTYALDSGKEADLTVSLAYLPQFTPQQDGTKKVTGYELKLSGALLIDQMEFDIDFEKSIEANIGAQQPGGSPATASRRQLVAQYKYGGKINLTDLLGKVSGNQELTKNLPALEISLLDAVFAWQQQNASPSKYLMGLALDLSLDLKKLPLAGSLLPSDRPFQVKDLQFLYATPTGLDQAEVQAINQYLPANAQIPETPITQSTNTPPANLPAGQTQTLVLKPGLNFRAGVQLGGAPQSLSLPSGEAPPAAPQAPQQQQQQPDKSQQSETSAPPPAVQWIDIQKSLGPITVNRIGGSFHDKKLWFVVDAALAAGGLTISLDGLGIGSPVEQFDLSKISATIQGMSLTYNQPPVEISGGFLARDNFKTFAGEALIKTGTFAISAFGMYQKKTDPKTREDYTSAFIFARLDTPLGGPPPFFVTGLCGGFGYNNRVNVPPVEQLQDFSFVQGALPPGPKNNDPFAGDAKNDPGKILDKLMSGPKPEIVPEPKEKWLAAGVKFTSFDLINSIAVLIVEFGNELEIDLIGLSSISMPPPAAPGATEPVKQYAYAELAIKMKLLPSEGAFTAKAVLTPNSFVLDPACKLTGGFGFYCWFGNNPHAGEFVLTLGGYHPEFAAPIYYPRVDRLGFNWPMPEGVTITGDAYFALTASAIMAGGGLSILYVNGNLRAWFIARVDALISWAPFFYSIGMKVSIGVSYLVKVLFISKTLKVELGASLYISGPKLKGKAHISWYVISRTVEFGAKKAPEPPLLKWSTDDGKGFTQTLLPHEKDGKKIKPGKFYMITVKDGLTKTLDDGTWVIRPNHFEFSVQTVIPATRVDIALDDNSGKKSQPAAAYTTVGIRPMAATLSESTFTVTVKNQDLNETYNLPAHFDFEYATQKVPAAKWGAPLGEKEEPKKNELLPDRLMGIDQVKPKTAVLTPSGANKLEFDLNKALQYVPINKNKPAALPLKRQADNTPLPKAQPDTMMKTIQSSLQNTTIQGIRTDIFKVLQEYGAHPGKEAPKTDGFAAKPKAYLYGNPLIKA